MAGVSWRKLLEVNNPFSFHDIFVVADTEIDTREVKEPTSVAHSTAAALFKSLHHLPQGLERWVKFLEKLTWKEHHPPAGTRVKQKF